MKSTQRIKAGFVINDRFEIVKKVGEGGFAMVFEGRDLNLDRQVAIKVLHGALLGGGDDREKDVLERFEREARLAATVDHGSIVKIYDVGEIAGVDEPFIVMEFLRGCSLQDYIEKHGALDPQKLLPLYQDLLVGLGFAHEAGIVHKDLKPDNIFYRYPGTIRESFCVVDFGIAHIGRNNSRRVTKNGEFFGTPAYMAPEYITEQKVSAAVDVYQMGLILLECLTGQPFLFHEDAMANLLMHLNRTKGLPKGIAGTRLGAIIERAISQDPEVRYQNAMEFAEALSEVNVSTIASVGGAHSKATRQTPPPSDVTMPPSKPRSTMPGVAALMDIDTGLGDDESEAAMSWHAEAELEGDLDSFAFEDTVAQKGRSTKFIEQQVVSDLSEASDIIEEREDLLRHRAEREAAASDEFDIDEEFDEDIEESDPPPTAEVSDTSRQRAMVPRSQTGVMHEVDFFEPDPPSNNKKIMGLLAALLLMIVVAGGVAVTLANNQSGGKAPENVDPGSLAAKSGETTPAKETSPPAETTPAKEAAEKKPVVIVQIATVPEGASVYDGETLLGKTPYPVEFESEESEERALLVRHEGYEDLALDISAQGPAIVTRALVKSRTRARPSAKADDKTTRKNTSSKASSEVAKSTTRQPPKETTSPAEEVEKKTAPKLVLPGQKKPDKKKSNGIVLPK
jgi:serine/threonine protein kinase